VTEDEVFELYESHKAIFGSGVFPTEAGELGRMLDFWRSELCRVRATPDEARRASEALGRLARTHPGRPDYRADHLPAIVGRIQAGRFADDRPAIPVRHGEPDTSDLAPAWAAWDALPPVEKLRRKASARARYPGLDLPGLQSSACVLEIAGIDVASVFPSARTPRRDRRAELADLVRRARMAPDVSRLPGDPAPPDHPHPDGA
jgi:hypothetical protein